MEADKKLSEMKSIYLASKLESKFKFGVEVPKTPKHALQLDEKEQNELWKQAITTELDQINEYKTFRILEDHELLDAYFEVDPNRFGYTQHENGWNLYLRQPGSSTYFFIQYTKYDNTAGRQTFYFCKSQ